MALKNYLFFTVVDLHFRHFGDRFCSRDTFALILLIQLELVLNNSNSYSTTQSRTRTQQLELELKKFIDVPSKLP